VLAITELFKLDTNSRNQQLALLDLDDLERLVEALATTPNQLGKTSTIICIAYEALNRARAAQGALTP
jgi:hypothetical protein